MRNTTRKTTEKEMPGTLRVFEIFRSLQGESSLAGRPCVFVRLAGCPLDCAWCDTPEAKPENSGKELSLDDIVATVERSGMGLVEVTGGEPLIQKNTPELCRLLLDAGYDVMVETNGAEDISRLPAAVRRIMDCKCPSSGMAERTLPSNFDNLGPLDEVKFAILDHRDYRYALSMIGKHGLDKKAGDISFSPVALRYEKGCDPAELAEWMIRDGAAAVLRPQLHKIIWPRGEPRRL